MESSKRPRTPGSTSSSSQNVQCLADGCNADLTQCRDYHRRHKVCEFHSKTPTVTISGREQRFCQQCSRFHLLVEFDDVKRSCRKRLDGHNKRRRKPQPDLRNAGLVLNIQQDTRLMPFSTPQICPGGVVSNTWTSTIKTENDYLMYNNNDNKNNDQTNWNSSSNTSRASSSAHHLQVMQQNNEPPGSSGYGQEQSNSSNQKTFFPSDSVLSLLSSQSAPSAMKVGFNPMVLNPHHRHHLHHNEPILSSSQSQTAAATAQIVHTSQFSGSGNQFLFRSDADNNRVLVSETDDSHGVSGNASFQFQEMFQNEPDESSGSGSHQTLMFLWE